MDSNIKIIGANDFDYNDFWSKCKNITKITN